MSTNVPADQTDPYAHLRAHAAQAKQHTVERLRAALAALESRGVPITTATIKQECGLDYSAYYRNDEAYALYRAHAVHFKPPPAPATIGHRDRRATPARTARERKAHDPLLAYRRPELAAKVQAAWAERDAARAERDDALRRYQNLLREHLECAQTIFTLQTKLAQYEEHRDYLRRTLQEREHDP